MNWVTESARGGVACAIALIAGSAIAADASPWSNDLRSSARLIAGASQGPELRAGVEVKLESGWKTYWRYPGDAGVPPRFDFTGSDNVRTAKVLWPAPHAFNDETGTSIGYKQGVVFPVRIVPREAGKPVTLRLKLEYAVCEKLCIPAEGRAELTLTQEQNEFESILAAAKARIPKPVAPADVGIFARRVTGSPKPLVMLDLASPNGESYEVFVEGPNADWAIPIPKPALGAPAGRRHYEFTLDGVPPGVDPMGKFDLTFTIVGKDKAIETTTHLD